MIPATFDFSVVRGSAGPGQGLKIRLKSRDTDGTLHNIPFDDVRLSIYNRKTLLMRLSLGSGEMVVTDPSEAEVEWIPTTHDTRRLIQGAKNSYELEVWNGPFEAVYMLGTITGIGGLNDDQESDAS